MAYQAYASLLFTGFKFILGRVLDFSLKDISWNSLDNDCWKFLLSVNDLRFPNVLFPNESVVNSFLFSSSAFSLCSFSLSLTEFSRVLYVFGFLRAFGLNVDSFVLCLSSSSRILPWPVRLKKVNVYYNFCFWSREEVIPENSVLKLSRKVLKIIPRKRSQENYLRTKVHGNPNEDGCVFPFLILACVVWTNTEVNHLETWLKN